MRQPAGACRFRRLYEATPLPEACRTLLVVPGRGHNDATRSQAFAGAMTAFVGQLAAENRACPL